MMICILCLDYVCMYVRTYSVCVYVYIYISMCVCVCMCVSIHAYRPIYNVYVYIYIYVYIYALTTAPSKYVDAVPKLMLTFPSATRMGP